MQLKTKLICAVASAVLLVVASGGAAGAHCDSVDGPVAQAAAKALETGNLYPVLAYAPATAEPEIKARFADSRKVRGLGEDARRLADSAFLETVIRLHRQGEGAAYTGLKSAGIDYGPAIAAADKVIEGGDLAGLTAVVNETVEHALRERLAHVRELQKVAPKEPSSDAEVQHARERVSAELGFITFAETLRQVALGQGPEHHAE